SCCGTGDIVKPYDSNTKTCCQGDDNIANVGPPKNGSCCGSYSAYPYDSNTTKCCIGKETMGETIWSGVGYTLTPSVLTDTTSCCGDEPPKLYDSNTERCCGPAISPVTCGKSGCCTASDCAENAANALISTPVCTSGQTVEWTCKNNGCEGKCVTTGNSGTQSSLKYIP
ncbi:MAG: hypothetical protein NTY48_04845, partial [Candidatus Diapherotrites archaeon]|nr:hypothetical protein [Candidatus Diapherotrites archaeon]